MTMLKRWLLILGAALLLAACSSEESPEAIAKTFFTVIYSKDVDGLFKVILIPGGVGEDTQAWVREKMAIAMQGYYEEVMAKGGIADIDIVEVTYNEDQTRAEATADISFKDGSHPSSETVSLARTADGWKILI